ncbi:MAG: phosphatidate cytidylyltransferase [Phycisphaerae bacterium]|nr:phosphatidate cytidylyltransferase [Phycisphaerae bacterium]
MGIPLSTAILLLLIADGYLSTLPTPQWYVPGFDVNLGWWLLNGVLVTIVTLVLSLLTTRELVRFAKGRGYQPFSMLAQIFVAGLVVGPYFAFNADPHLGLQDEGWGMLWLACAVGTAFFIQAVWLKTEKAIGNLATTIFIIFYAGGLAGFMTKMRMEFRGSEGIALLIFTIFVVKMTDTGAFFVGKTFGRHKMIPWLSPKKTWEGFVGGILVATLCSVLLGSYLQSTDLLRELPPGVLGYPWGLVIFGILMGMFSVAGDLSASLLKRDAAVQDSGATLQGLGGVLDVFDSPLIAVPPAWFFWARLVPMLEELGRLFSRG